MIDTIKITQKVKKISNSYMPDETSDKEVSFTFKRMTCSDYWSIEKDSSTYRDNFESLGRIPYKIINYNDFRMNVFKKMILECSLFKLNFNKGVIKEDSYQKLISLPSALVNAVLRKYEETIHIDDDEENVINIQSSMLFSKNNVGVENACEAISLHCNLSSFWEKYGLNYYDLKKLDYKTFQRLKIMAGKANEATNRAYKDTSKSQAGNIIMGGKTVKSRGKVVPDNGTIHNK